MIPQRPRAHERHAVAADRLPPKTYALHNETASLRAWSSNRARHRLFRTGNPQLSATLHRIALTQAHWHPEAGARIARHMARGNGGLEALRIPEAPSIPATAILNDVLAARLPAA